VFDLRAVRFAIIVCLSCSIFVSGAALGLRDRQEANKALDMRRNILKSVGLLDESVTREQIGPLFEERMRGSVLTPDGRVVENRTPEDVDPEKEPELLFLYERIENEETVAYTFPISGKGLWSTLYGYFALEADLVTVRGITFYQHGETPGLGGEIEKPWFQSNFVGKKILDATGALRSVTVVKGAAKNKYPDELEHYVDGISGATITADAVTVLLKADLERYEPYFAKLRGGAGEETS
jgi:Na+-transporting NADH:ubiquinone oxidoreductase subunit C